MNFVQQIIRRGGKNRKSSTFVNALVVLIKTIKRKVYARAVFDMNT
jgi:hypothetical protein